MAIFSRQCLAVCNCYFKHKIYKCKLLFSCITLVSYDFTALSTNLYVVYIPFFYFLLDNLFKFICFIVYVA